MMTTCPGQEQLSGYVLGLVSETLFEDIAEHVERCPSCEARVQTLEATSDTIVSALRRPVPADPVLAEDRCREAVERIQQLGSFAAESRPGITTVDSQAPPLSGSRFDFLLPAQGPDEIGRLAHYRVLKVLGEGGMGIVFLAEDTLLSRTVALKTMKPEVAADPRYRQRFLREARAAAKVEDDHIVPIYGVGEDRGVPWLAMPFLKGQSLNELLKRVKVLKPAQVVRLGAQVARGLAAAHAAGLIHRDVKPANIWVEPEGGGRAKLLDFGLAREERPDPEGTEPLTRTGAVVGTPEFIAPEQAEGEPLDARADLFSLGCVLYRAVTGRLPFQGVGMMGTLRALATQTPPPPDAVNPAVPQPLSALIMNLLAKDRSARPASAATVAAALEALREQTASPLPVAPAVATPVPPPREERNPWADLTEVAEPSPAPAARPPRRWRRATAAVLLLALGGATAAGVVILIKNSKGKVVPQPTARDGDKRTVEIKDPAGAGRPKEAPRDADADRGAAVWVLSIGGKIKIRRDGQESPIQAIKDIGAAPFELLTVDLTGNKKVDDKGLAHLEGLIHLRVLRLRTTPIGNAELGHLKGLANLTTLDLYATKVNDDGLVHLKRLTNLTELQLFGLHVSSAGLVHLKGLANLTQLDLSYTELTDLEPLKNLGKLTHLRLLRSPVSNAGLKHLRGLTNLTHLVLHKTNVDDAGLVHLKGLTKLQELSLAELRVTDAGMKHLKGLTQLTSLQLHLTQVGDAGLDNLKGLTKLTELSLYSTPVSDRGLVHLKGLSNLTMLDLTTTRVSDAGLVHLTGLTKLTTLYLYQTRINGTGLRNLVHLPLRTIRLWNSRVSPSGFAMLRSIFPSGVEIVGEPTPPSLAEDLLAEGATLVIRTGEGQEDRSVKKIADLPREPFLVRRADCTAVKNLLPKLLDRLNDPREYEFDTLEALDLSGCAIDDNLNFAKPLQNLRELTLSGTKVADLQPLIGLKLRKLVLDRTPVTVLSPIAGLTQLEDLSLGGTKIAQTALQALGSLPNLRRLDLAKTGIDGRGVGYLAKLAKLTELSLADTKVNDPAAAEVGALTKLERLSLAGCRFSDAGLKHLAGLRNLAQLDLARTQVTADGVAALQKALPKCKIVSNPAAK
jgi:serine/threonine protein kinase/Leucine-rich repeat (LRR) protein